MQTAIHPCLDPRKPGRITWAQAGFLRKIQRFLLFNFKIFDDRRPVFSLQDCATPSSPSEPSRDTWRGELILTPIPECSCGWRGFSRIRKQPQGVIACAISQPRHREGHVLGHRSSEITRVAPPPPRSLHSPVITGSALGGFPLYSNNFPSSYALP